MSTRNSLVAFLEQSFKVKWVIHTAVVVAASRAVFRAISDTDEWSSSVAINKPCEYSLVHFA